MLIYLTRHGKTNQNKECLLSGNSNFAQLIEEGKDQAEKIGIKLKEKNIEKIFSSPLDRAIETSNIINKSINVEIIKEDLLREFDFGSADAKSDTLPEAREILIKRRIDLNFHAPNGECYNDLIKKAKKFIDKIKNEKCNSILIVSHAGIMRTLAALLTEQEIQKHPEKLDTIDCLNGLVYIFNTETQEISWLDVNSDKNGKGLRYRTSY